MNIVYFILSERAKADFHKNPHAFPFPAEENCAKKEGTVSCLPSGNSYFLKLSFRLTLRLNTR